MGVPPPRASGSPSTEREGDAPGSPSHPSLTGLGLGQKLADLPGLPWRPPAHGSAALGTRLHPSPMAPVAV